MTRWPALSEAERATYRSRPDVVVDLANLSGTEHVKAAFMMHRLPNVINTP